VAPAAWRKRCSAAILSLRACDRARLFWTSVAASIDCSCLGVSTPPLSTVRVMIPCFWA
jgi:hypothetical protein